MIVINLKELILHNILGWHQPTNQISIDGCYIMISICKYCDKIIGLDSQGNWVTIYTE